MQAHAQVFNDALNNFDKHYLCLFIYLCESTELTDWMW